MSVRRFDPTHIPVPHGYESFRAPAGFDRYVLEIGAGVGWHALSYARANPRHCIVAVEHSRERFAKMQGRYRSFIEKCGPCGVNLFPLHADAESVLVHCVPEASLDHIFLLYPNPYPKAAQDNKRWHNMPFMEALISRLKPGGILELATNQDFYAAEFFTAMRETWKLKEVSNERISIGADPDFRPRTHFEKKYYLRHELLHLIKFAR